MTDRAAEPTPTPRSARGRWSAPVRAPVSQQQGRQAEPTPEPTQDVDVVGTYECRQAAQFNVKPKETRVSVDGQPIGVAGDFGGGLFGRVSGKLYNFQGFGTYLVEFSLRGYQTVRVKVIVRADADKRIANIDFDMLDQGGGS